MPWLGCCPGLAAALAASPTLVQTRIPQDMPAHDRRLELLQRYLVVQAELRVAMHTEALRQAMMARGDEAHTTRCLTHVLY